MWRHKGYICVEDREMRNLQVFVKFMVDVIHFLHQIAPMYKFATGETSYPCNSMR